MEIRIDEQNTRKNSSALGQDRNITEGKKNLKTDLQLAHSWNEVKENKTEIIIKH
jgi:hypothetical protein